MPYMTTVHSSTAGSAMAHWKPRRVYDQSGAPSIRYVDIFTKPGMTLCQIFWCFNKPFKYVQPERPDRFVRSSSYLMALIRRGYPERRHYEMRSVERRLPQKQSCPESPCRSSTLSQCTDLRANNASRNSLRRVWQQLQTSLKSQRSHNTR